MKKYTEEYLTEIGTQEKQFDALYRGAASLFGLPDCSMWVLYYLVSAEGDISQQDLIEKMMFPKQTINSAPRESWWCSLVYPAPVKVRLPLIPLL